MNDDEIMVILILFHSGGFRCFRHYYKEYVCKHLVHFSKTVYLAAVSWIPPHFVCVVINAY